MPAYLTQPKLTIFPSYDDVFRYRTPHMGSMPHKLKKESGSCCYAKPAFCYMGQSSWNFTLIDPLEVFTVSLDDPEPPSPRLLSALEVSEDIV